MIKFKTEWDLLKYSLLRVNDELVYMNLALLERGNFSLNQDEKEKLKAIATVYQIISDQVKEESTSPVLVIHELTEQMMTIDYNYSIVLERLNMINYQR